MDISIPHLKYLKMFRFNIESEAVTWHLRNKPLKQHNNAALQAVCPGLRYKNENMDNIIDGRTGIALLG